MADAVRMALAELVRKAEAEPGLDVLREGVRVLAEAVMDLEVEQHVGAARHERSEERTGQRNGYRERTWDTRVGTIGLRVPRVRDGSYVPALLEPRTRAERALLAVVQEAYVGGVSTRRVDALVKSLGLEGISFQRLEPPEFVSVQAVVLVLPAVEGLLADAVPPTGRAGVLAGGVLLQDADDLLVAEPALAHAVLPGTRCPGGLPFSLDQFSGVTSLTMTHPRLSGGCPQTRCTSPISP